MEYEVGDLILEDYEVIDVKLGGFGIVYICREKDSDTLVAIKSFQDRFFEEMEGERIIKNFYNEAYIWLKLCLHNNITEIFSVLGLIDKPHIVMEYVEGGSLNDKISHESLNLEQSLDFSIQFCDGMIFANTVDLGGGKRGIVHRDIKPSNMLLTYDGTVKVTDFGLVKALGTPTTENPVGTPEYMSPEQFETMDVDTRSDIYSFGVVMYQMLTGNIPFYDPERRWKFYEHHHQNVMCRPPSEMNPSIPKDFEAFVLKCLQKSPRDRFQSFGDLRTKLIETYTQNYGSTAEGKGRIETLNNEQLFLKGYSLFSLENYAEALEYFNRVLKSRPDSGAWLYKGMALQFSQRYKDAIGCYDQVLKMTSASVRQRTRALVQKAAALVMLNKYKEALACTDAALKITPDDPAAWCVRGSALSPMEKDKAKVLECYDKALEIDPTLTEAWIDKAFILFHLGKYGEAVDCSNRALMLEPRHVKALVIKTHSLTSLNRLEEALTHIEKALEIDPRCIEALVVKANLLSKFSMHCQNKDDRILLLKGAKECLDRAFQTDPSNRLLQLDGTKGLYKALNKILGK